MTDSIVGMTASAPKGPTTRARDRSPAKNGDVRAERKSSATRRALVESEIYEKAAQLFAERGFAGTSLQDIADALGVTRPALYYYVKSKDEILERLVIETAQNTSAELVRVAADETLDCLEKLRRQVTTIVSHQAEQPARFRLMILSEADLPEALAAEYNQGRRQSLAAMAQVIQDGIRAGVFRPLDPRVAALGVIGMCNWTAWWVKPDGRDDLTAIAAQFAEMAVASVRRDDDRVPSEDGVEGALKLLRQDLDYLQSILDL